MVFEWLTYRFLRLAGVRESAVRHARTFLLTRDAVFALFETISMPATSYDLEMLIVAAKAGLAIRTAKLVVPDPYRYETASRERLDHVFLVIEAMLRHSLRGKRAKRAGSLVEL
jgi:hypothetical protein